MHVASCSYTHARNCLMPALVSGNTVTDAAQKRSTGTHPFAAMEAAVVWISWPRVKLSQCSASLSVRELLLCLPPCPQVIGLLLLPSVWNSMYLMPPDEVLPAPNTRQVAQQKAAGVWPQCEAKLPHTTFAADSKCVATVFSKESVPAALSASKSSRHCL